MKHWVLCVVCLLWSVGVSQAVAEDLTIDVSLGQVASGVNLPNPSFWIGGSFRGVLPATVEASIDASARVAVYAGGFGFTGTLRKQGDQFVVDSGPNTHCLPYNATWKVAQQKDHVSVVMSVQKVGDGLCRQSPSVGAPNGKGKLRFATEPSGGILYYPTGTGFTVKPTPTTLVVDFTATGPMTVVFKSPGYYDCTTTLSFRRDSGTYFVSIDGQQAGVMTENTANAPLVACKM